MWLYRLQNTVQMVLLINNNKSNGGWQKIVDFKVIQAYTESLFCHPKCTVTLSSLPTVPFWHNSLRWRPHDSKCLNGRVVGPSLYSFIVSGLEDKVTWFITISQKQNRASIRSYDLPWAMWWLWLLEEHISYSWSILAHALGKSYRLNVPEKSIQTTKSSAP